ncbi:MAG: hypothetical protein ABW278_11315 [Steroidobacteraceae bacterium]
MRPLVTLAAMACIGFAAAAAGQQPAVLAQDLKQLRAPGRVDAALWTRRADSCTLQLVLSRRVSGPQPAGSKAPALPLVQAWLVRADGAYIPALSRADLPRRKDGRMCSNCSPREVMFSYPLTALAEAVAVSISVDGAYYSQALQAFPE